MSFGLIAPTGGAGNGIFPTNLTAKVNVNTNLTNVSVVMLDFTAGTSTQPGDNSKFSTAIAATTALANAGIFAYLPAASRGNYSTTAGEVEVILSGIITKADIPDTTSEGDRLIVGASILAASSGIASSKVVAIALQDDTGADNTADIWFDGVVGFGHYEVDA